MPRKPKSPAVAGSAPAAEALIPPDWHYETTVEAVEAIVARLETGELELGEVFEQFGQAVTYLKQCEQFLQGKQEQLGLLIETLEETEF